LRSWAQTGKKPQEFQLGSCGVAAGFYDRVEPSIARQESNLGATAPGPNIDQTIVGGKVRVVAIGVQYKYVPVSRPLMQHEAELFARPGNPHAEVLCRDVAGWKMTALRGAV
jgi:hypothetical protein